MQEDKLNMIMEFADGTLEAGKEDQLFLSLSADDELKQIFKAHIDIKNAIRSGSGNVVLPASSKSAVFSALSLGSTQGVGANKVLWTATASLFLAVITLLLFLLYNGNDKGSATNTQQNNYVTAKQDIKPETPHIIAKGNAQAYQQIQSPIVAGNHIKKSRSGLSDKYVIKTENTETANNDIALLNKSEYNTTYSNNLINSHQSEPNSLFIGTGYSPVSSNITMNSPNAIALEFRGSRYKMTKSPTINPKNYSPLNNMALGISYNFNNNLSAGLDIREETFFLRYKSTSDRQDFIYEQQPNFTTISASIKYKLNGWNGLQPYATAFAGFNSVGFVGRAMLGAEYNIFENLSIMLGVDFSNLTYTHQNNYFNSSKFGLNYGLIYSF